MEVVPRGGPHRRLIPRRLENPEEADYTSQLSSGRARLFAFEESNTRLDLFYSLWPFSIRIAIAIVVA